MIAKQSGTFWYSDRRLISGLFLADFKLWHIGEHVLDNLVWAVDTVTLILNRLHGGIYIGLTLMLTHVGLRMCGATGPKLYFHCKVTFLNNLDITQHCNAGKSSLKNRQYIIFKQINIERLFCSQEFTANNVISSGEWRLLHWIKPVNQQINLPLTFKLSFYLQWEHGSTVNNFTF